MRVPQYVKQRLSYDPATDGPNVIYPYNGLLFRSIDTCCNRDKPWNYYAEWKNPGMKAHRLCDYIDKK